MKRSNRIVLFAGIVLAIASFAGIVLVLGNQTPPAPPPAPVANLPTVYAKVDMPLGTVITADMLETRPLAVAIRPIDAYGDPGKVIGNTVRTNVKAGAQMTAAMFGANAAGAAEIASRLEPGLRAIAVTVDQATGVGSLISVGDRVDMVIGLTAVPVVTISPETGLPVALDPTSLSSTSSKLLLQNMQVIGTLVPPAPVPAGGAAASPAPAAGAALIGSQQLVILAVTAQQAEVIKFAQVVAGSSISLVLRSPRDFRDGSGNPVNPEPDKTSGTVLRTLIDDYGVLPPQVIPAINLPTR